TAASLSLLAPGGTLVLYGLPSLSGFAMREAMGLAMANQTVAGFSIMPDVTPDAVKRALTDLFALTRDGVLRPRLATYQLEDAAKAHADMEARRTLGKVVLLP
ncbi:MAG TPA: zinc-binding dehydrogenase, partial [Rhizomicrobium sp.]|nr:zinc-binding dehydrogenase [Rhizomicrobium sp.]